MKSILLKTKVICREHIQYFANVYFVSLMLQEQNIIYTKVDSIQHAIAFVMCHVVCQSITHDQVVYSLAI